MVDACLWDTARVRSHFETLGTPCFAARVRRGGAALLTLSNSAAAAVVGDSELEEVLGELTALRTVARGWPAASVLVCESVICVCVPVRFAHASVANQTTCRGPAVLLDDDNAAPVAANDAALALLGAPPFVLPAESVVLLALGDRAALGGAPLRVPDDVSGLSWQIRRQQGADKCLLLELAPATTAVNGDGEERERRHVRKPRRVSSNTRSASGGDIAQTGCVEVEQPRYHQLRSKGRVLPRGKAARSADALLSSSRSRAARAGSVSRSLEDAGGSQLRQESAPGASARRSSLAIGSDDCRSEAEPGTHAGSAGERSPGVFRRVLRHVSRGLLDGAGGALEERFASDDVKVQHIIAHGPAATVSRVSVDGALYARKTLDVRYVPADDIQELLDVAARLALVLHENVLRHVAHVRVDGAVHIYTELALDGTLADRIARHSADGVTALAATEQIEQVTAAVAHVHAHGLLHRDVKPENVLCVARVDRPDPVLKLADFGDACVVPDGDALRANVGTPRFAAPETLSLDGAGLAVYGTPADVWSLAMVMFNVIAGCEPYAEADTSFVVARTVILGKRPSWPPLADANDFAFLMAHFLACTAPNPADRPTAGEVLVELGSG